KLKQQKAQNITSEQGQKKACCRQLPNSFHQIPSSLWYPLEFRKMTCVSWRQVIFYLLPF
ncbi:MAG: hypothetical protein KH056_03150, partial [Clostridiales bacterium]|nr:hypothetical protein [Clostridiales bacterium]